MQELIQKLLKSVGEDPQREGLLKTPKRFAEMMKELTAGYDQKLEEVMNGAVFPADAHDLVLVRDIELYSLCEHHMLPFFGKVHIGYIPDKNVVGLSKMPRIVEMFSRRLQTQERLGSQICDALEETLKPKGVGVMIEAEHLCMKMRGVEEHGADVMTRHLRGELQQGAAREEFLQAVQRQEQR